jgi:hypothetical protein
MPRLNIPLSTRQSTRPRFLKGRVLWILAGWLVLGLTIFVITNLWLTRDTLSALKPEGTIATIHLTLSKQVWTKLISDFNDLFLIPGKSLTISDLAELEPKEISVFIMENNMAMAIRVEKNNLDQNFLASYGVGAEKLDQNRWFFSNKPLSHSNKERAGWSLGFLWPKTIGTLQTKDFSGRILTNKDGYSVNIPKIKQTSSFLPALPEQTTVAVSFQPGAEIGLSSLFSHLNVLLNPLETTRGETIVEKLKESGGIIVLTKDEFLIETKIGSSNLSQILQTATALQNPTTKILSIPDGSLAQEIVINKNGGEITSIWSNGREIRTIPSKNSQFFVFDGQDTDIFASDQALLEEYLGRKQEKSNNLCGRDKTLAYLKPTEVREKFYDGNDPVNSSVFWDFISNFTQITLKNGKINLCY